MSTAWSEEFILHDVTNHVTVAARRALDNVVHVEVPCRNLIQVKGSCIDTDALPYRDLKHASAASRTLEFILNSMLTDHLEGCDECKKKIPPELLAMSIGASEMKTIILGLPNATPPEWETAWKIYAAMPLATLPVMLLFQLMYPKASKDQFGPPRETGARIVWQAKKAEDHP